MTELTCVNCGGGLSQFTPLDEDGLEYYCPNNDCKYATVYDERIMSAFNLMYQEDFDNAKDTWGQWGINIIGKPRYKPETNSQVNIDNNQITELTPKAEQTEIKALTDQRPKHYRLELDNIIGYPEIKDRLRDIVNSLKPVHFLMIGAPSVAKTVFLESMEAELKPQGLTCHYIDCSTLTKAGLGEYIQEHQKELANGLFFMDEVDSIDKYDQKSLLNLLSRGIWQTTNSRKRIKLEVKGMKIIATCNRADRLIEALRSRFLTVYLKAYTRQEYIDVAILMLQKKYKYINEELAKYIAEQTANLDPRYIRNADRVAILCKHRPSFKYIDDIIATIEKYKIPDDVEQGLDQQT